MFVVLSKAGINTRVNPFMLKKSERRQVVVASRAVTPYTVPAVTLVALCRSWECSGVAVEFQIRVIDQFGGRKTLGGATKTQAAIYCGTLLLRREYTGQPTTSLRPCSIELYYL